MDSSMLIPCNFTTAVFLLFPVIIFFIFFKKWKKLSKPLSLKLPPGPNTLPSIGNLHLISFPPFRCLRDLAKKYGPIMHLKLGEVPIIVVSSPEIAKQILKDNDPNFADRPQGIAVEIMLYNYIDFAYCPYGDYWKQMRKISVVELLSAKNVRSFGSIRNNEVSRLINSIHLSSGKPLNLTEKVFSLISSIICRAAVGKVCKDIDAMSALVKEALQIAGGFAIADVFPSSKIVNALSWTKLRSLKMRRKLDEILDGIINEHRENLAKMERENGREHSGSRRGNGEFGNEDLVDVLLRIKESGELQFPIGNDHIKALLFDMFSGGTHSSSSTIDWTMTELMRNPRVMAKAQAELRRVSKGCNNIEEHDLQKLKYLKLVIKESLRLHPPGPMIPRASREEREINGYTIPAKFKILVNIWAIQRDAKYWTNPEVYEPERFENQSIDFTGGDFEFLPFGSGKRMCPGIALAMANVELPLAQLLYNFNWKLPDGVKAEEFDMTENYGLSATRLQNLILVATPYEPLA